MGRDHIHGSLSSRGTRKKKWARPFSRVGLQAWDFEKIKGTAIFTGRRLVVGLWKKNGSRPYSRVALQSWDSEKKMGTSIFAGRSPGVGLRKNNGHDHFHGSATGRGTWKNKRVWNKIPNARTNTSVGCASCCFADREKLSRRCELVLKRIPILLCTPWVRQSSEWWHS
jgi:hypothetical protein